MRKLAEPWSLLVKNPAVRLANHWQSVQVHGDTSVQVPIDTSVQVHGDTSAQVPGDTSVQVPEDTCQSLGICSRGLWERHVTLDQWISQDP
ncbi:hypothetical protein RRG08_008831 [Elysia crispata]|uniref:Uncharacterized protein n=1 Tax=Elysia crispata TaxID=231223 RepID=A0AAE1E8X6_9GAST|nr:hypothetical protein RRG08_008831 [Elysia crispata]